MIDLHTHTSASDGTYSPASLVTLAKEQGIEAIAVTDHDTIEGLAEARETGERLGVEVIPGMELSVEHGPGSMHILGLLINPEDKGLNDTLSKLQESRSSRNPKIIEKLNRLGMPITMEEVEKISGGGQVGRPHIAAALLKNGHVSNIQEAFDKYLKKGATAYFERYRLSREEAADAIHGAGGLLILAHPGTLGVNGSNFDNLLSELKETGFDGIEVFYNNHSQVEEDRLMKIADKLGFIISGGTDFHGENKPSIKLGVGYGNMAIPYEVLQEMKQRI
ncbi:MAG: PHP domain-containing protein [Candidatus Marinimicrobia bacterium]|nr:PHP domain-containing protein [Candidatus Neomarinimicrobiota bacterium]